LMIYNLWRTARGDIRDEAPMGLDNTQVAPAAE